MKNRWWRAVVGGSAAAVMAVGIMMPSAAEAATSNQVDYSYIYKYIQTMFPGSEQVQAPVQSAPAPVVTKPVQAPVQQPVQQPAAQPAPVNSKPAADQVAAGDSSSYVKQVVSLVNQERAKSGLKPLTALDSINRVAAAKAADMRTNGYFSHTSPTYGSPFDMMKSFGVTYKAAGENIAMGQRTPQEVMKAWMESPGHRSNILSANFTHIGVGFDNNYWVQMFVGK